MAKPDMRTQLETTFARIESEREAKEAAELAADSVPTDNVTVLRERATRHAHRAVDEYWGYFNDIQTALDERVITPLLNTVGRLAVERDRYRLAWKSASLRAEARGEGIERIVKDRESYQGWLEQEQANTQRLTAELTRASEDIAFLERNTLPELRRTVQHHEDGKKRWRERAEKAEARVAELEATPAVDTFPAWLAQRFDPQGAPWDGMSDDDRTYWEHQARAVRRAVARGGFKSQEAAS
jgi:chromosome segregation ATPase